MECEMKSERRHELRENDLADSVEQLSERLRPYVTPILSVAIGVLVLVLVGLFVSSRWEATRSESWDTCLSALVTGDQEGFREVIIRYPGTPAAQWSELILADRNLSEATDLLFTKLNPENDVARERLETAAAAYVDVLSQRPTGMVAERATMGLAKARESLGDLDQARRGYEAVADEFPASPMANLAAEHAEDLAQDKTREFYNWFAKQRLANAAPEETSASKEDTSSDAGQQQVEPEKEKGSTNKKSTQEKDAKPSSAPESLPEE
ncbi:MAG TPA: hypothetical protein DEB70_11860 [Planctomycetaceae bacterium]|nr:hypothetical protein [Planctomycetaceae bacterium]